MVKKIKIIFIIVPVLAAVCFLTGCNIDLPGLVVANDLDVRLEDRNHFPFLGANNRNWNTNPAGTLTSSFKFIVLSDTHIENGNAFGLEKLADVVQADTDIKFVVITGDITQNATVKDIDKFIEIADSLGGVPCYPVAGNHDIYYRDDIGMKGKAGWSIWREKIGSTNYRIDFDTASLFILDSANAFLGKDQLDWLEREIKKTAEKNVFVFTHAPLFVTGPADMQQMTDTKERARILSILKGKCDIMFMGHLHKQMVNTAGGVIYLAQDSYIEDKAYYVVTVTDGKVSWERKVL